MKRSAFLFGLALLTTTLAAEPVAHACGGCFVQQTENTQVTGHRMVLSVSKTQTTLWDQISYSGNPSEFAWVLPIHGQVDIGVSSDALFSLLDQSTRVQISSPQLNCAPQGCNGASAFGATSAAAGGSTGTGGVTVIAQEVVGPYETVQLKSTDPLALATWLADHGYAIPSDVKPVIDAYVAEGFDFLALRLVPGQGVDAMKPIRVTSPGSSPVLPLRMVAGGTGAVTPITLWIVGEGRYQPSNMPSFQILPSELVWDWDTQSSNYASLRQAGFDSSGGKAWLLESAEPQGGYLFQQLVDVAQYDPTGSGYGDANGANVVENATADVAALTAGIDVSQLWVTRVSAELSRSALAADLSIGASPSQSIVSHYVQVVSTKGTAPTCPAAPVCSPDGGNPPNDYVAPQGTLASCDVGGPGVDGVTTGLFGALGLAGLAFLRAGRRRRRLG